MRISDWSSDVCSSDLRATAKRARKGCDWIVANDVSGDVMGGSDNTVHLVTDAGVESWERLPKPMVAARLAQRIAEELGGCRHEGRDRNPPEASAAWGGVAATGRCDRPCRRHGCGCRRRCDEIGRGEGGEKGGGREGVA